MGLVLLNELVEPIVHALDLIDNAASGRGVVAGNKIRVTQGVVGGLEAKHRIVETAGDGRDGVGRPPTKHVIAVRMHVARAVNVSQRLANTVNRVALLVGTTGRSSRWVGILHSGEYVVAIDIAPSTGRNAVGPLGRFRGTAGFNGLEGEEIIIAVI